MKIGGERFLREDIKKAAIEGEVLYNFLKDNKLMIIKYAICRQQYNSLKKIYQNWKVMILK